VHTPLLRRFNIHRRLTVCFMLVITLMLVGDGVLLWQSHLIRTQMERLNGVSEELSEVLRVHADLLSFYERLGVSARAEDSAGLLRESEKLRAILLEDIERTRSAFRNLPAEVKADPTVLPTLESIDGTLLSHLVAIRMLTESGEWEAVRTRLDRQIRPLESLSSQLVNSIAQEVSAQRALASFNIERAQHRVLLTVPLTGCLTLLIAALSGWAITRSITEPLGRLVEGSSALARGEFQHQVLVVGQDELAQLGKVFNITAERLQSLYEELQQLVDFVPQVISVLGPDGKWIYANRVAREYTGLTLDEYRSVDVIAKAIHPDDAAKMGAVRERGLSANFPFEVEARLLGKDGVYRWFLFRYNPLLEHGHARRWYVSGTEIESRKQEEDRVRKENVRLEERTRIAQELHDTLLQSFLGASMQLGVALDGVSADSPVKPRLDRILQLMKAGIEEGRKTLQGLRSPESGPSDLALALSGVQQELAVQPGIDFRITVAGKQRPLQPPVQHEIYRIGREALVNAFRHSRAKSIEVELEYADSDLRMRVRDNGCGIDPQVLHKGRAGHWGLAGMRERATRIGGLLKISGSPSDGTEVTLSVPGGVAFLG